jgi:two-component system chemotaxis response regulator CheY
MFSPESRILVIDDLGTIRSLLKESLKTLGFKNINEAENGRIGLEMMKSAVEENAPYDLIISDWNMPEMTGIELLDARNEDETLKDTPFLMVTIESESQYVLKAASKGVSDFVVKPFTPKTLENKIRGIYKRLNKAES